MEFVAHKSYFSSGYLSNKCLGRKSTATQYLFIIFSERNEKN